MRRADTVVGSFGLLANESDDCTHLRCILPSLSLLLLPPLWQEKPNDLGRLWAPSGAWRNESLKSQQYTKISWVHRKWCFCALLFVSCRVCLYWCDHFADREEELRAACLGEGERRLVATASKIEMTNTNSGLEYINNISQTDKLGNVQKPSDGTKLFGWVPQCPILQVFTTAAECKTPDAQRRPIFFPTGTICQCFSLLSSFHFCKSIIYNRCQWRTISIVHSTAGQTVLTAPAAA